MDIFSYGSSRRIGADNVLRKVDALVDWSAILSLLRKSLKRSGPGPQGYDEIVLFKCLLVGQWHGLSYPELEESLHVRFDFMLFSGLVSHGTVPDEITHRRFRNALVKAGAYDTLPAEICGQIEDQGLKIKEANAAIPDATLIESSARPRTCVEAPPEGRAEDEASDKPAIVIFSADKDARWVKKGRKSMLGHKGFSPGATKRGSWTKFIPHLPMLVRARSLEP